MRSLREKVRTSAWPGRVALTFAALSLILTGAAGLQEGQLHYANYWGGSVFAPLAIVLGFWVLVIVVVKWRSFNVAPPKNWPARTLGDNSEQRRDRRSRTSISHGTPEFPSA